MGLHLFLKSNFFLRFIYFGLCWVFIDVHGLSLVAVSGGGGLLFITVCGLLIALASFGAKHGL